MSGKFKRKKQHRERMKSSVKDIKRALFERDGARCSVCGKEITFEDAQIGRAFPGAPGGSRDIINFWL